MKPFESGSVGSIGDGLTGGGGRYKLNAQWGEPKDVIHYSEPNRVMLNGSSLEPSSVTT